MQGRENQKKGRKEEINRGKVDRKREIEERQTGRENLRKGIQGRENQKKGRKEEINRGKVDRKR